MPSYLNITLQFCCLDICFEAIKNGNKSEPSRLKRKYVIKFSVAKKSNNVKFTEYFMYTAKYVLIKRVFTNGLSMGLPL